MSVVYISIGSNIGDSIGNCMRGIKGVEEIAGDKIVSVSSFYKSEPIGYSEQNWFVNCVIKIETDLTPYSLLNALQGLEKKIGRKGGIRYGPRIIDFDILLFNNLIINEKELIIPHPRMHERRFVLKPLTEIDGSIIHPTIKKSVRNLLFELGSDQKVVHLKVDNRKFEMDERKNDYGFPVSDNESSDIKI